MKRLFDEGMSQSEIAAELGVWKSTVAYHVRHFGLPADPRFARRYDWQEIQGAVDAGASRRSVQLHHVNGDGRDNRLENLELLCPNCHSQTATYGGRNGHRRNGRSAG